MWHTFVNHWCLPVSEWRNRGSGCNRAALLSCWWLQYSWRQLGAAIKAFPQPPSTYLKKQRQREREKKRAQLAARSCSSNENNPVTLALVQHVWWKEVLTSPLPPDTFCKSNVFYCSCCFLPFDQLKVNILSINTSLFRHSARMYVSMPLRCAGLLAFWLAKLLFVSLQSTGCGTSSVFFF